MEKAIGIIPLRQTSFSTMTLMGVGFGTVLVTAFMGLICPEGKDATPPDAEVIKRFDEEDLAKALRKFVMLVYNSFVFLDNNSKLKCWS